ncbi:hypothetical protein CONLIGDRAFT_637826 [Coniochaeta ligniaria NRRL 30616]|uniref:Uncharacterized protein n=1 Tax=Coniochaeta ligniaria NRRL 30616 TaxID=1408157 RepID=A0A1J7I700_9PEZI|nr:hypothetical protein CONLIGDRAFT_637826 [Coniochaeta ligniaria NRRL 30616]
MSEGDRCQTTASEPVRRASNSSKSDRLGVLDPERDVLPGPHQTFTQEADPVLRRDLVDEQSPRGFAAGDKEGSSTGNPDSPLRIVVRCLSHRIPGDRSQRTSTMANIICQHFLQRDMDPVKERIRCLGLPEIDGRKVKFLLESGTVTPSTRLEDVPLRALKWTGKALIPRAIDARTRSYLHNLPFKHQPPVQKPQNPKTMAQMRESMDDEAWNRYMAEVMLRKLQYKKKASSVDRSWAEEHPELFYDVVQQYTAQQRWHRLELPPSLMQWVEAPTDRGDPNTFTHLVDVVLDKMGIETEGLRRLTNSETREA